MTSAVGSGCGGGGGTWARAMEGKERTANRASAILMRTAGTCGLRVSVTGDCGLLLLFFLLGRGSRRLAAGRGSRALRRRGRRARRGSRRAGGARDRAGRRRVRRRFLLLGLRLGHDVADL